MELATGAMGAGGAANAAITEQALSQACSQLKTQMGAQRFSKEFGSDSGCRTKMQPEVDKIIAAASAACAGKADPSSCIATQAAAAEQTLVAKYGGGPSADTVAAEIATEVCTRLQAELGDRFTKKYGSAEKCQAQIAAKAAPIASAASAKCKAAADQAACINEQINAQTDALSASLGAGPTPADITEEIADNACTRLKTELGSRYTARYKTDAGCRQQVAAAAEPFAAQAIAACAKEGGKASCITAQVSAGTEQLQAALGAGPSTSELAADIAEQVCPQLMADEPDGFARTYQGLDKCRTKLAAQIPVADLKAAISGCSSARNIEACTQQAAQQLAAKLAGQLSGPSLDDVVLDAEGLTCQRIAAAMGAAEFKARFVTIGICREKVEADVVKLAKAAWATCKAAKDKAACSEDALAGPIAKLAAQWGAGPSSGDIASRLATEACNQAAKELGAAEFQAQLKGLEACKARIAAAAARAATDALDACAKADTAARSACIQKQVTAAAPALEKQVRAGADLPAAQLQAISTTYADQICSRAREQIGSLLDTQYGGDAKCRSWMLPVAQRQVASVIGAGLCSKGRDQACLTQQLDASAPAIQKQYFPVPADPTFYEINATAASYACSEGRIAAQKAGLVAVYDKKWPTPKKDTTSNCALWFNGTAAEKAPTIIKTCGAKRPADVRRACFSFEIERASRTLTAAVEQAVRTAAALKK